LIFSRGGKTCVTGIDVFARITNWSHFLNVMSVRIFMSSDKMKRLAVKKKMNFSIVTIAELMAFESALCSFSVPTGNLYRVFLLGGKSYTMRVSS
jgi:hypothetical protein